MLPRSQESLQMITLGPQTKWHLALVVHIETCMSIGYQFENRQCTIFSIILFSCAERTLQVWNHM